MNIETEIIRLDRRVQSIEDAVVPLRNQVAALEQRYFELQNELSLVASLQRSVIDLEARVNRLEDSDNTLNHQVAIVSLQNRVRLLEEVPRVDANEPDESLHRRGYAVFPSTAYLVSVIETMFDCADGHPRSSHMTPEGVTYPYQTLVLMAPADMGHTQEKLRNSLYGALSKLRATCGSVRPKLYWRYAKEERIAEECSVEVGRPTRYKIRTRVAIPEADFRVVGELSSPEGSLIATLKE